VVRVVEDVELPELQVPGERAGLGSDPLHHVAVARDHPDVVVDDGEALAVEVPRAHALGERHAHGVAEPLAQGAGRGLDP
jgi:hypothetical protein